MRSFQPRHWKVPLALVAVTSTLALIVGAAKAPLDDSRLHQETAKIVTMILEKVHLAKPTIGDDLSKSWCKNFLKSLDPQKLYFTKADIAEFLKSENDLDDQVKAGDVSFARKVFDVYLKRHDERQKTIMNLIKQPYDFTVVESLTDDPKKLDYPADAAEAAERWRKLIKYELLLAKIDEEPADETVRKLQVRYRDRNRAVHQIDMNDLLETYLTALMSAIDPHSGYMSAKSFEDFSNQTLHLSLEGIGARLRSEDGYPIIDEVVPGGAADKDGRLGPEDKIVGIKLDDGKTVDFVEMKLNDVVRYIRGPRGTKARLLVIPANSKERVTYELTREKVELKDSAAQSQIIETKNDRGQVQKLGFISLPTFYGDTLAVMRGDPNAVSATLDCRRILRDFQKQGVTCAVMDLRGNPGGLLTEAETLSGLFINTGPVVQVRNAEGVVPREDDEPGTAWDGPLVVLIDKTSASASEIFAGVIQDYKRGLILGDSSTFGKGTVQQLFPINEQLRLRNIPDLGAIKLTIQQFYRANGDSTQINGVRPDLVLPSLLDMGDFGEGKIENALKFDRVPPIPHEEYQWVNPQLVAQLNNFSQKRRETNKDFLLLKRKMEKLKAQKETNQIPLNEKAYRDAFITDDGGKSKEERDKERAEKKRKERGGHDKKVWDTNYYNDEVVKIVQDYLTHGTKPGTAPVRAAVR